MSLAFQGWRKGLVVHGMAGFDYARAKAALNVPDDFRVEAMACIGKPGSAEELPESHRSREAPSPRRSLAGSIFEGPYRES